MNAPLAVHLRAVTQRRDELATPSRRPATCSPGGQRPCRWRPGRARSKSRQHISVSFFLSVVNATADALTDHGYDMVLSRVDAEHLDLASCWFDSGRAIGVILIDPWPPEQQDDRR